VLVQTVPFVLDPTASLSATGAALDSGLVNDFKISASCNGAAPGQYDFAFFEFFVAPPSTPTSTPTWTPAAIATTTSVPTATSLPTLPPPPAQRVTPTPVPADSVAEERAATTLQAGRR